MDVDQYENFPVASVLLPKALRAPIGIIYQVVRTAGNIADEGDWSPAERHARLADFRAGLDAVAEGRAAPVHPLLFGKLAGVIAQYKLPLAPFYDDPQWRHITDWRAELAPYYDQAKRMLGVGQSLDRSGDNN